MLQALTAEQKALAEEHHQKCLAESGVDIELVEKGRKGEFVVNPKLREYLLCFLKESEFVDDAGNLRSDKIKEKLSQDFSEAEINEVLTKCQSNAKTPQEKAAAFYVCYWTTSQKHVDI